MYYYVLCTLLSLSIRLFWRRPNSPSCHMFMYYICTYVFLVCMAVCTYMHDAYLKYVYMYMYAHNMYIDQDQASSIHRSRARGSSLFLLLFFQSPLLSFRFKENCSEVAEYTLQNKYTYTI
jgi:hypothetical protein